MGSIVDLRNNEIYEELHNKIRDIERITIYEGLINKYCEEPEKYKSATILTSYCYIQDLLTKIREYIDICDKYHEDFNNHKVKPYNKLYPLLKLDTFFYSLDLPLSRIRDALQSDKAYISDDNSELAKNVSCFTKALENYIAVILEIDIDNPYFNNISTIYSACRYTKIIAKSGCFITNTINSELAALDPFNVYYDIFGHAMWVLCSEAKYELFDKTNYELSDKFTNIIKNMYDII